MPIPRPKELRLPVLRLLSKDELTVPEIADRLADHFNVTDEERSVGTGNSPQDTFQNHIRLAIQWLKAGKGNRRDLVEGEAANSYRATDLGCRVIARAPEVLDDEFLLSTPEWRATRRHVNRQRSQPENEPAVVLNSARLDAAIRLFTWIYGEEGFASERYLEEERDYKVGLSEEWRARATPAALETALAGDSPQDLATELGQLLTDPNKSNLLPWRYDIVLKRLSDPEPATVFLRATQELLFKSDREAPAIDEFNAAMGPLYAKALNPTSIKPASHVIPSLMLWLSEPDHQFFLRPDLYNRTSRCLSGAVAEGQGQVMTTAYYQAAVAFARELERALGPLAPRDMIDVQGFTWGVFSHARLWFGGKTYSGTQDMLPEFISRQVYAVHFAARSEIAQLLQDLPALDKTERDERRATLERQLQRDTEKKALLAFFDLARAPGSLLLAKSVWYDQGVKRSLLRISGAARTGATTHFDEELGRQLSVTWLTKPDRVVVLGEHFPKPNMTLTSLPLDEALDVLALEELEAREEIVEPPPEEEEEGPRERIPPVLPVYTIKDFTRETGFPAATVERWLSRLGRKMQIILQGPPGTGKTFLAERLARVIVSGARGFSDVVQFHPSYGYEDFMQGIRPRVLSGQLNYELEAGRFLAFCEKASSAPEGAPCVLIIDEVNRADLSRVFGELMYLLEYRDKEIPLAAGGARFRIPKNVYLIGTMNTADRSIALVDHALRRRFSFIHIGPEYDVLEQHLVAHGLAADGLLQVLRGLNAMIGDRNYELGISFFMKDGAGLRDALEDIWRGEIEPYLEEYFYDQLSKVETFRWESLVRKQLIDWAR
jgi:AAA domain (dynein-related subfamily)/Mrr N-terminal domain